jgi:CRP-like cAMP-binding protein
MPNLQPLKAALTARAVLSDVDLTLLDHLRPRERSFARGSQIVAARTEQTESCLMLHGVAARETLTHDGKRQISALHFAGDFVDLHGFVLKEIDHGVTAVTDCTVGFISHASIAAAIERSPRLGRALWMLTAIDAAIQRAWIACLGRSRALPRLGHLLCETYLRLKLVGLADQHRFPFPITQTELADVMGLSPVHMNRTIQELRATSLVTWDGATVVIRDWDALLTLSEFDASYLNITQKLR